MLVRESRTLGATASTVPAARRFVLDVLRAWDWDAIGVADAALLTTELATNAVEHAQSDYTVTIDLTSDSLWIGVMDRSSVQPTLNRALPVDSIGGRGLMMVESIADGWGVDAMPSGKSVWFQLTRLKPSPGDGR